jgi:hypothetical protein
MLVELVYFTGCPNVAPMRALLVRCLQSCDIETAIVEVNTDDPAARQSYRGLASPAVLVNSVDVLAGELSGGGKACRLKLPTEAELISALGGRHEAQ